jgi:hypothetical protein
VEEALAALGLKSPLGQNTNTENPASFLRLPAELRNRIYELVLIRNDTCPACDIEHAISKASTLNRAERTELFKGYARLVSPVLRRAEEPEYVLGEVAFDRYMKASINKRNIAWYCSQPALTRVCKSLREETLPRMSLS